MILQQHGGTRVDEVAEGIYRISTRLDVVPGGFTFNSYLVDDDEPLLFHTGLRAIFPATLAAIATVIEPSSLRWVGGSHFEADEFGALNLLLDAAPQATPFGAAIGVLTSLNDFATRPARGFAGGEAFSTGRRRFAWQDTPHVPHGWDCGLLHEATTGTLFCGDLFTQPGGEPPPLTESEILSSSESLRASLDYFAHSRSSAEVLESLAQLSPKLLACQHGSAYRGDAAAHLRHLAQLIGDS